MDATDTYAIMSEMIVAVLLGSGPVLALALVVGLVIAFFQALTQIQEMTLTFVPKIVAIFLGILASSPFIYATLRGLSDRVFDLIASGALLCGGCHAPLGWAWPWGVPPLPRWPIGGRSTKAARPPRHGRRRSSFRTGRGCIRRPTAGPFHG